MFQGSVQWVSRVFERSSKGRFKGVSRVFQKVLSEFKGSFKGVPLTFLVCFKEVSMVFQGRLKSVSMEI